MICHDKRDRDTRLTLNLPKLTIQIIDVRSRRILDESGYIIDNNHNLVQKTRNNSPYTIGQLLSRFEITFRNASDITRDCARVRETLRIVIVLHLTINDDDSTRAGRTIGRSRDKLSVATCSLNTKLIDEERFTNTCPAGNNGNTTLIQKTRDYRRFWTAGSTDTLDKGLDFGRLRLLIFFLFVRVVLLPKPTLERILKEKIAPEKSKTSSHSDANILDTAANSGIKATADLNSALVGWDRILGRFRYTSL